MTRSPEPLATATIGPRRSVGYHRPTMFARLATLAAVFVLVVGCSAASAPSREPASLTPASSQPSLVPVESPAVSPGPLDLPQSVIDPVVADIAKTAGVPVTEVVVVSAEPVTFPDGSLGCPVPGLAYTQVVVDGFKIVATAGGQTFDYRGSGSNFRRCQNPPS